MTKLTPEEFHDLFLKASKSPSGWYWAHGGCYLYAFCFLRLVGGQAQSYLTHRKIHKAYGHCFIKFNGKFYDSESPEGLDSWKKLQSYMIRAQQNKVVKHGSTRGIVKTWGFSQRQIKECNQFILEMKALKLKQAKAKK